MGFIDNLRKVIHPIDEDTSTVSTEDPTTPTSGNLNRDSNLSTLGRGVDAVRKHPKLLEDLVVLLPLSVRYDCDDADVSEFIEELSKARLLVGGGKEDWEEVETLVKEWQNSVGGTSVVESIRELGIRRLNVFSSPFEIAGVVRSDVLRRSSKPSSSRDTRAGPFEGARYTALIEYVLVDALFDFCNLGKDEMTPARIEAEILRKGGWLFGVSDEDVLVYFPLTKEVVLKKLSKESGYRVGPDGTTVSGSFVAPRTTYS